MYNLCSKGVRKTPKAMKKLYVINSLLMIFLLIYILGWTKPNEHKLPPPILFYTKDFVGSHTFNPPVTEDSMVHQGDTTYLYLTYHMQKIVIAIIETP